MSDEIGNTFDEMMGGDLPPMPDELDVEAPEEKVTMGSALANFSSQVQMEPEDLVIPRLRLAQGLTQEVQDGNAKPGFWLLTGYDPQAELTVVPMLFSRQRVLRDQNDNGTILCRSVDSHRGVGIPGGNCDSCPMAKWTPAQDGGKKNTPPQCSFSYVYICYVVEFETMALVEFRRTSIQAGKNLNTMAAQRGLGNFAVKLKSVKEQGKRGAFYQIMVQPCRVDASVLDAARSFTGMA